ncbi:MAG TPA: FAD-dependent oxidoreductase [Steroidobacteraceae bacterium]
MNITSVAVIGAGLAGLSCARRLAGAGVPVRVFESQRAAGGRLATRRFEAASFDHGAQYLTVSDLAFRQIVEDAHAAGAAGLWQPDWPDRARQAGELWVGTPGMTALPRYLARGLDIEYGARIVRLEHGRRGWALLDDRGSAHVDFGAVVLAMPAPLAAVLAAPHTLLAARVRSIPMAPCWAAMIAFEEPLAGVPDAGFMDDPILRWFARNGSKPRRDTPQSWVLHAGAEWSRLEFDRPARQVQKVLLKRFSERIGRALPRLRLSDSHRWRHARVEAPLGEAFLLDREARIGFCGDWCLDARVEAAFLSGDALGTALVESQRIARSGKMHGSQ